MPFVLNTQVSPCQLLNPIRALPVDINYFGCEKGDKKKGTIKQGNRLYTNETFLREEGRIKTSVAVSHPKNRPLKNCIKDSMEKHTLQVFLQLFFNIYFCYMKGTEKQTFRKKYGKPYICLFSCFARLLYIIIVLIKQTPYNKHI